MTDRSEKLNYTKKLIRAILLTGKDGYPLNSFSKTYKDFENKECPFKELGFQSMDIFLKSIPDVVEFREVEGKTVIFGVPDARTKHVHKMVQNQKTEANFHPRRIKPSQTFSARPQEYQKSKMVPREIQSTVDQLMKDHQQGIPLNEFADVYFKRFSKPIINKYSGFDNIDDLLEAMRKIVYVRDDTNGIKMVRPTYHRMQEWKITKEENNGTTILGQPIIPQMVRTNLKDLIQNYSNGLRLELLGEIYQKKYKEKLDVRTYGCQSIFEFCCVLTHIFSVKKSNVMPKPYMLYPVYTSETIPVKKEIFEQLTDDIIDRIKEICTEHHSNGILVDKVGLAYERSFGEQLNVEKFGFKNHEELFKSLDIFEYKIVKRECLKDRKPSYENLKLMRLKKEEYEKVIQKKKANEKKLASGWPIHMKNISTVTSTEDLKVLFDNFGTVLGIKTRKSEAVIFMETKDMMYTAYSGILGHTLDGNIVELALPTEAKKKKQNEKVEEPKDDPQRNFKKNSHPKWSIPRQKLPDGLKINDYLEIMVGEILNPHRFYIQIKEHTTKLNKLMRRIDEFYKGEEGASYDYEWEEEAPFESYFCAVLYHHQWHRGRITRYDKRKDRLTVDYIDYGTVAVVRRCEVRKLHEEFTKLPSQAIRCRLSSIVSPFDEPWSKESSDRFLKMVKRTGNLGIMANVRGVSIPDKCICVWLYDTATNDLPNGIQINHELCREGLAVAETDESYLQVGNKLENRYSLYGSGPPIEAPDFCENLEKILNSHLSDQIDEEDDEALNDITIAGDESLRSAFSPIVKANTVEQSVNISNVDIIRPLPIKGEADLRIVTKYLPSDVILHIINHEGEKYATSAEISLMIPKFNGKDVLRKMLQLKKTIVPRKVIYREEDENLFEELIIEDVKGVDDSHGEINADLSLYLVKNLPKILSLFYEDANPMLVKAIEELGNEAQ